MSLRVWGREGLLETFHVPNKKGSHSGQIKDVSLRRKMLEVLEENRGKLCDAGLASGFLAMTPKAQTRKEKNGWGGLPWNLNFLPPKPISNQV